MPMMAIVRSMSTDLILFIVVFATFQPNNFISGQINNFGSYAEDIFNLILTYFLH